MSAGMQYEGTLCAYVAHCTPHLQLLTRLRGQCEALAAGLQSKLRSLVQACPCGLDSDAPGGCHTLIPRRACLSARATVVTHSQAQHCALWYQVSSVVVQPETIHVAAFHCRSRVYGIE